MFCDLVGSTEIAARLDPEVLSDVIGAFQKGCVSAVTGFGGSVAKYMGDAALVYFGYPEAQSDAPAPGPGPHGGVTPKPKEQPHALAYAPGETMLSTDATRERVPVTRDEKWPMPDARRKVTGRAEGK